MYLFFSLSQPCQEFFELRHMLQVVLTVGQNNLPMKPIGFVTLMAHCHWLRMMYLHKFITCTLLGQLRACSSSHLSTHITIDSSSHYLELTLIGLSVKEIEKFICSELMCKSIATLMIWFLLMVLHLI